MRQPWGRLSRRAIAGRLLLGGLAEGLTPTLHAAAADSTTSRDGRLIILPSLKQNGGIHSIDTTTLPKDMPVDVIADGYWSPDDGGGGRFRWDPTNAESEDNFIHFAPHAAAGPGRWRRILNGADLSFEMAGARGDGIADDFVTCQQMLLIAHRRFHQFRVVLGPGKSYLLDHSPDGMRHQATRDNQPGGGSLLVPNHCIIAGPGGALGKTAKGVPTLSAAARFVLHPRMTIRLAYFAELSDLQILRKDMGETGDHFSLAGPTSLEDMQAQVDTWMSEDGTRPELNGGVRSVAVTNDGTDSKVHRVLVMGFNTAYLSEGSGRPMIDQLFFDTAGRGVEITRSASAALVQNCYSNALWSSGLDGARNRRGDHAARPGIAYDFHDKTDGLRCVNCSGIGWATGLRLSNVWGLTVSGLNVEPAMHPRLDVTRGILLEDCVSHVTIIDPLIDGFTYKIDCQHRPLANVAPTGANGSAGLGQYASASISILGGSLQGNASDPPGHRAFRLGPHSAGSVIAVILAGFPERPAILVEKDVGIWKFIAIDPSFGEHQPLFEFKSVLDRNRVLRFGCDRIDATSPQWTIAGTIVLNELATSPAGLPSGSLWRNGNAIHIVP